MSGSQWECGSGCVLFRSVISMAALKNNKCEIYVPEGVWVYLICIQWIELDIILNPQSLPLWVLEFVAVSRGHYSYTVLTDNMFLQSCSVLGRHWISLGIWWAVLINRSLFTACCIPHFKSPLE